MGLMTISVGKGLRGTPIGSSLANQGFSLGWTPVDYSQANPVGIDPITFMLRLMISTGDLDNWSGTGTNYDFYQTGLGLGIPQDRIDIATFESIQQQDDYDPNMTWWGFLEPNDEETVFAESLPSAKKFLEEELCRPFGLSLMNTNIGRIKLVRPKHPQKFHVSRANDQIRFRKPAAGADLRSAELTVGIYTGPEMATEVARALNAATGGGGFTSSYNTSGGNANKLQIANTTSTWDMEASQAPDKGWTALGFTGMATGIAQNAQQVANNAKGAWPSGNPSLDKNDLWDVQALENRGDQITQVIYLYGYDSLADVYTLQRAYADAEAVNLGDPLGTHDMVIKSKGLIGTATANPRSGAFVAYWKEATSGCDPVRVEPSAASGVDDDSWAKLYALMLLDRYKWPPLKFKAKLRWKWNTLEVGDVVKVSYDIPGVFTDRERNKDTLDNRIFEVTQVTPNFAGGFVEATFLGHRYVSY